MGWGFGSSRTGFELEDTSTTNFGGLDLGLEDAVLEHIPAAPSQVSSLLYQT